MSVGNVLLKIITLLIVNRTITKNKLNLFRLLFSQKSTSGIFKIKFFRLYCFVLKIKQIKLFFILKKLNRFNKMAKTIL